MGIILWARLSLLISIFFSFTANASFTGIISDIDDTVKITNVQSVSSSIRNGLGKTEVFAGMAELYEGMLSYKDNLLSHKPLLFFLSGSPTFLHSSLENAFSSLRFPSFKLVLKDWLRDGQSRYFKFRELQKIYAQNKMSFVLIGDDTEFDPEAYSDLRYYYPEAVSAIYIRRVTGRAIPSRVYKFASYEHMKIESFYTPLDIAIAEFAQDRLGEDHVSKVAIALLNSPMETVFPAFAICPKNYRADSIARLPDSISIHLRELVEQVELKTKAYCTGQALDL